MEKFDYENFDYDAAYQKVQSEIKKPNIFIVGATGVGKSSLINDIFDIKLAGVGRDGKPETRGVHPYDIPDSTVNLFDTEGYEINSVADDYDNSQSKYFNDIIGFIDKQREQYPDSFEKYIHEVWYCVSSKRFFDIDKRIINSILDRKIPVAVIITKVDTFDEKELEDLNYQIKHDVPEIRIFTYSVEISSENEEVYKQFVQEEELLKWAASNLNEWFEEGFVSALKGSLKLKRNVLLTKTIPGYALAAAGAVVSTSFVPLPLADSIPLMAIQVKMAYSIINTYNMKGNVGSAVGSLVSTSLVSYLGKNLASQLVGLIPFFGSAAKAVANVTVAATVTLTLGAAITVLCERYLEECIDKNGCANIPFTQFFTAENLKDSIDYVNNHKSEFNFEEIIRNITSKFSK